MIVLVPLCQVLCFPDQARGLVRLPPRQVDSGQDETAGRNGLHQPAQLAQLDAFLRLVHRTIQVVPFIQQPGQSHVGQAGKGRRPVAFSRRQLQGLSLGFGCLVQPALHLQRLAQHRRGDQGQVGPAASLTQPDRLAQSLDGRSRIAAAQGSHAQGQGGNTAREPFSLGKVFEHLLGKLGRLGHFIV